MLEELLLKFGPSPGSPPLRIAPGAMTVLVGPNNSGKSRTLREIRDFVQGAQERPNIEDWDSLFKIISSISPRLPQDGPLREAVLLELTEDIEPFRGALAAARLSPRELFDEFDISHLGPIFEQFKQLGQIQELAAQHKIDPALLTFDLQTAKDQPSLLQGLTALLKEAIGFIERNEDILERVTAQAANVGPESLIGSGALKMEGYLHHFSERTILLDGRTRLSLTDPSETHSLHEDAQGVLMRLFFNERELNELRKYVVDAFERHLSIDLTGLTTARFVLSDEPSGVREKAIATEEARRFFQEADDIADLSDGLKSYVGLHATLLSQDYRIILLDEPEAFLHPPLARRLGANLTRLAASRGATIIAATHSPFFLMGCLEAGPPTTVVRLGYHDRVATARQLSAQTLHKVMNDPLLRASRVLDALFHRCAVVCEGDSDHAFYDEINERLRREFEGGKTTERYARDCLFINSHGKGSIDRMIGLLRTMDIPAVAIADLDVIRDSGVNASKLLAQAGAGAGTATAAGQIRTKLRDFFEAKAREQLGDDATPEKVRTRTEKLIKRGGITHLSDRSQRADLKEILRLYKQNGIFLPPYGEVEAWLRELGKQDVDKSRWLGEIFAAMGSLVEPSTYLAPAKGDVWDFMREIAQWLDEHILIAQEKEDP